MHLNQLYGYFGRKLTLIETKIIDNKDLSYFLKTRLITNIIEINDNKTLLLMSSNNNIELINQLNSELNLNIKQEFKKVKANVAIAAAVTSYARIEMIKLKILCLKLGIKILYTDTDSLFTDKPLPIELIGKELGQLKDELNGLIIKEGYFLGIKKYGYYYYNENGNKIVKSVFSGVERNSLNFDELTKLSKGEILIKNIDNRFYKSLHTFNITIMDTKISIKKSYDKNLINGKYIPLEIYHTNKNNNNNLFYLLKNKLLRFIKIFNINI